jgi:hypothetical protein
LIENWEYYTELKAIEKRNEQLVLTKVVEREAAYHYYRG